MTENKESSTWNQLCDFRKISISFKFFANLSQVSFYIVSYLHSLDLKRYCSEKAEVTLKAALQKAKERKAGREIAQNRKPREINCGNHFLDSCCAHFAITIKRFSASKSRPFLTSIRDCLPSSQRSEIKHWNCHFVLATSAMLFIFSSTRSWEIRFERLKN